MQIFHFGSFLCFCPVLKQWVSCSVDGHALFALVSELLEKLYYYNKFTLNLHCRVRRVRTQNKSKLTHVCLSLIPSAPTPSFTPPLCYRYIVACSLLPPHPHQACRDICVTCSYLISVGLGPQVSRTKFKEDSLVSAEYLKMQKVVTSNLIFPVPVSNS